MQVKFYKNSKEKIKNAIPAIILSVTVFISALTPIITPDFGFYYREGERIALERRVPDNDILTFTSGEKTFLNHMWLSELLYYVLFSSFGAPSIVVVSAFVAMLTFLIGLLVSKELGSEKKVFVLLCLSLLPFCRLALIARPLLFGFFLSIFFIYGLLKFSKGEKKFFLLLPLTQAIWVNIHGSFVLGIFFCLIFFALSILRQLTEQFDLMIKKDSWKKFLILFFILCLSSLINPWTFRIFLVPFKHFFTPFFKETVTEWMPVSEKEPFAYLSFYGFVTISLISFIAKKNRLKLTSLLFVLIFILQAITSFRFTLQFFILSSPFVSANLSNTFIYKYIKSKVFFYSLVLLFFILNIYSFKHLPPYTGIGFIFDESEMPFCAVNFLKKENIHGNIFNDYDFGGYLELKLYPHSKVYIDGRGYVHSEKELKKYLFLLKNPVEFEKEVKKYNITIVLVSVLNPLFIKIAGYLRDSPKWAFVYFDDLTAVFVRKEIMSKEKLQRLSFKYLRPQTNMDYFSKIPEIATKELYSEIKRVFNSQCGKTIGSFMLGYLHFSIGEKKQSMEEFKKAEIFFRMAIEQQKEIGVFYYYLGKTLLQLGEKKEAEEELKKALKMRPKF